MNHQTHRSFFTIVLLLLASSCAEPERVIPYQLGCTSDATCRLHVEADSEKGSSWLNPDNVTCRPVDERYSKCSECDTDDECPSGTYCAGKTRCAEIRSNNGTGTNAMDGGGDDGGSD